MLVDNGWSFGVKFSGGRLHPRLVAMVPEGSGAAIVHATLASALPSYAVHAYGAYLEFAPQALWARTREVAFADLVHAAPDHGVFCSQGRVSYVITFHNYFSDAAWI